MRWPGRFEQTPPLNQHKHDSTNDLKIRLVRAEVALIEYILSGFSNQLANVHGSVRF